MTGLPPKVLETDVAGQLLWHGVPPLAPEQGYFEVLTLALFLTVAAFEVVENT